MLTYSDADGRPLAVPNPTTQPFFDAAAEGRLALQRCPRHGFFFYPRSRCPECLGTDWEWQDVSGRGRVYSFTVDRVGHDPAQAARLPLVIAVVELDEGPRLTADLIDCTPEQAAVDMPVTVAFEQVGDAAVVAFRPV